MTRGRKPKPTAMKLLAGNPGKRPINSQEPKFAAPSTPPPVPDLFAFNEEAAAEWVRIVGELHNSGVLATVDRAALTAYCDWWSQFVKASKELERVRYTQTAESGYECPSVWLGIKKQASEQMHKYMTEFGLTPSSRSRLKVTPPETQDPFDVYLSNPVGKIG